MNKQIIIQGFLYKRINDQPFGFQIILEMPAKQWEKPRWTNSLMETIRVFRVESKNEAIALGLLQHLYFDKLYKSEHGSYWCITNGEFNYGSNLYNSYRLQGRANYFVLNKLNRKK